MCFSDACTVGLPHQIPHKRVRWSGHPQPTANLCEGLCRLRGSAWGDGGRGRHVRRLIHYGPQHSVSAMVNSLKGVSSRLLRSARPDLAHQYWKGVLWSPSYLAATWGGAPISILKQYIESQKTPT